MACMMRHEWHLNSIANSDEVALMNSDRGLSGPHLARLLGAWRSSGPAYAALARALRLLVLDGRLPLRTRLPGERELAEALGVSRTTATAAYAALRDEGFLASRRGAGSLDAAAGRPGRRGRCPAATGEDVIDLSCAASAAPEGALHAALAAATAELPRHLPGPGYDAAGLPVLRAAIAALPDRARRADRRPIRSSSPPARCTRSTLLLRVLAGPGRPRARRAPDLRRGAGRRPRRRRPAGARSRCSPDGWDLEMLAATLRQAAPRLAYLIADHQNPTGLTMPRPTASGWSALARATRTPLVIDEAIAGLHLDGASRRAPVAALDPAGETVITIGSMSKTFWAGLRIGWVRANPALVQRLAAARAALDISQPGARAAHGGRAARARRRRSARASAPPPARAATRSSPRCATQLPGVALPLPAGGLSLWVELDAPRSTALAAIADRYGLRLAAGPRFGVDGAFERFVRLPYSLPGAGPGGRRRAARRVAWRGECRDPSPGASR